ncbi:hypothetical protein [Niabella aquatica]
MTGVFSQKNPGNIVLLFMLGIFIKLPAFFHDKGFIIKDSDGAFYTGMITFLKNISHGSPFCFAAIAFALNLLIAFILNNFINTERLMNRSNYLTAMAYMLITSFLPSFNLLSANLVASLLLLTAFTLFYKSYNNKNNIFNGALLIGLASLFFLPALFFTVWAFLALAILRPFRFSEWMVLLLGLTAPYYFYAAHLFLSDQASVPSYFYHLSFLGSQIKYSLWHAGALFFLLAPLLAGIYYMQANSAKMLFHIRKGWYLVIWYLVISIATALFDIEKTSENMILTLVPAAAFHGYGYLNAELKLYPKISFWLTVIFIISCQLYSNMWY